MEYKNVNLEFELINEVINNYSILTSEIDQKLYNIKSNNNCYKNEKNRPRMKENDPEDSGSNSGPAPLFVALM